MGDIIYSLNGVNGQLTVYEDKIVIGRKGALGFIQHGMAGDKTIPITNILSVQLKEGTTFMDGYLQFGIAGAIEARGGVLMAQGDENTIRISKKQNSSAKEIADFIEKKILSGSNRTSNVNKLSPADELKKFKELFDSGIITQEEYEAKKKQLLAL